MLSLPRRAFRLALSLKLEYLAPVVVGAAFLFLNTVLKHDGPPPPQPVIVVGTTPVALFASPQPQAVRIVNLEVNPRVIVRGETATFLNGLCNDSPRTINVQIYLGAQMEGDPLVAPVIDFVGTDTPTGRVVRYLDPGCLGVQPIVARIDDRLTPGKWRLHLVVMVTGDPVPIVKTSPIFEVLSAR